ncbi:MAG: alpha-galactosidase [Planctomycetes bacterium]|nr:alpha-galactosidase [Planctomycetota bacterium]
MQRQTRRRLPASAAAIALAGALAAAARGSDDLIIENGIVKVSFSPEAGTFTVRVGIGAPFAADGRLRSTGGRAMVLEADGSLGRGRAIEVKYLDGSEDRISLAEGSRFVCFETRFHNPSSETAIIDRASPVYFTVPGRFSVLGCDGLTSGEKARTSYLFLAGANSDRPEGFVAGWLTQDRGSGIVLSEPAEGALRITARLEYGKLRLAPGESARGEVFAAGFYEEALDGLEAYADAIAQIHRIRLPDIPNGYCTWYSNPHGGAADEKSIAELAEFCGRELAPFGFDTIQIDDRWQGRPRPQPNWGPAADFTRHDPKGPYPSGMKVSADRIRAAGICPGIWLLPFAWDPSSDALKDHRDWFVKKEKAGDIYYVDWAGWCIDMTHPDARAFLGDAIRRITKEWGYGYLKLDGLWSGMAAGLLYPEPTYRDDGLGDAVFHDPSKTNVEAYRMGLRAVREAAGPDVYLLGCNIAQNMRTLGASIGLLDGMRVGRDIGANWDHIIPSVEMGSRLYFLHGRVWHNDPDCLLVREPLTLEQARAWASWIALSGQLAMVSEWLPGLPAERLDILKRVLPNTGLCGQPLDLFESPIPRVWHLTARRVGGRRDCIGLFNWDAKEPATIGVRLDALDLPDGGEGSYVGFEYWTKTFLSLIEDRLALEVPPAACRVIAIRPARDHPQVVGTSRHVAGDFIGLHDERWDAGTKTLSGTSRVVGGDPYEIYIAMPEGGADPRPAPSVALAPADLEAGAAAAIEEDGPLVRVRILSPATREVRWRVTFP